MADDLTPDDDTAAAEARTGEPTPGAAGADTPAPADLTPDAGSDTPAAPAHSKAWPAPAGPPVPLPPPSAHTGLLSGPNPVVPSHRGYTQRTRYAVGPATAAAALAAAVLLGALAGAGGYMATAEMSRSNLRVERVATPAGNTQGSPIASIAEATLPSVVSISADGDTGSGTGSGFIIDPSGLVVTNNHVVSSTGANTKLTVHFADGSSADATIVGTSPDYDLAVLSTGRTGLPSLAFADSDTVAVGDTVVAVGSPLGLDGTVTSGIVSSLHRPVPVTGADGTPLILEAIQTDAAINPGNSGGPLVDASGAVIGINSAILTAQADASTAGSIGLGFAVPSNTAARVAEEISATGRAATPYIGVTSNPSYAGSGAQLATVVDGSPAAAAGLQVGDVIVKADNRVVASSADLVSIVRSGQVGRTIPVTVDRGGKTITVDITPAAKP